MSCARLDRDVAIIVHDFGPRGFMGPVNVNLTQGLHPGGTITVVVSTDHELIINIFDKYKNVLLHFVVRIYSNELILTSKINGVWGVDGKSAMNPILKGVRAAVTIVFEETGYKIFINGKEELFFKHRFTSLPSNFECVHGLFYKVVYMNQIELIPL